MTTTIMTRMKSITMTSATSMLKPSMMLSSMVTIHTRDQAIITIIHPIKMTSAMATAIHTNTST